MPPLKLYAGRKAKHKLHNSAFSPNLFTHFLGASGGPKWFVLAGLDKALFAHFFDQHFNHMNIIGSSAGAFRAACFAQRYPAKSIELLAHHYSRMVYSKKPTPYEVTQKARELIDHILPTAGIVELMENKAFTVHFLSARCKGLMSCASKWEQGLGIIASAGLNNWSRNKLKYYYDRIVFSSKPNKMFFYDPHQIPTEYIKMGHNTVVGALLASGSIPIVMEGTRDIPGAPEGIYRDGGLLDYHFDLGLPFEEGITMYPHFYPHVSPGWFDKGKKRPVHRSSYDNMLMLVPSEEFIASLPYQRLPDRRDFSTMDDASRIKYWQAVIKESERLGDYFLEMVQQQRIPELAEPLPFEMQA
jgi:hypothetical protein